MLNLTNHPSRNWPEKQIEEAFGRWGEVQDLPFPAVDPNWTTEEVAQRAVDLVQEAVTLHPDAVLCQGEMTMTYALTALFQRTGILVVAACTERQVVEIWEESGNMTKTSRFVFQGFRAYPNL